MGTAATGARLFKILGTRSEMKAEGFALSLMEVFGDKLRVSRPVKCIDLRIMNLDDAAVSEELRTAIISKGGYPPEHIHPISEGIRGGRVAHVGIPVAVANVLLDEGGLVVGWMFVRVQRLEPLPMCRFKCILTVSGVAWRDTERRDVAGKISRIDSRESCDGEQEVPPTTREGVGMPSKGNMINKSRNPSRLLAPNDKVIPVLYIHTEVEDNTEVSSDIQLKVRCTAVSNKSRSWGVISFPTASSLGVSCADGAQDTPSDANCCRVDGDSENKDAWKSLEEAFTSENEGFLLA
ncbi:unnamed protein product [Diatraea saccharalis]|uniref:Uncharacterized protein n=1 Tax=Diatraea saccharalis TaxID=40085 RepID=A0A9N9QYA8_9NEOP|nr:unnamed protein product [Diatraea saccharalis]